MSHGAIRVRQLTGAGQKFLFQIPTPYGAYQVCMRLAGTFVGTVQLKTGADMPGLAVVTTYENGTTNAGAATQNAPGVYVGIASTDDFRGQVECTAFTSGEIEVEIYLIQDA